MVHPSQDRRSAIAARQPARIAIIRKGKVRSFAVRPWLTCISAFCCLVVFTAIIGAAGYLIYRDDLLGAAMTRQIDMQYAYEDRIAALRAEIDRVTSRHVVEKLGVKEQLALLLERQADIERRQDIVDGFQARARASGIELSDPQLDLVSSGALQPLLSGVQSSLLAAEQQQSGALDELGGAAQRKVDKLSALLSPLGVATEAPDQGAPQGGPFIPAAGLHFAERSALLERSLSELADLRRDAAALPLRTPLATRTISSRFGYRLDPFLKRPALHSGIDFAAATGGVVRATAAGTVASAGWSGGYGNMVEVRHEDGLSTRYGHLSAILVKPGDRIDAGSAVGRVGSSGRSTGPHLHYEVRRVGKAVDPAPFLAAGRAL